MKDERTDFGQDLIAALEEVRAHRRGEVQLAPKTFAAMPASRITAILKSIAKSSREFSKRFGIPARTLDGWEQGRKLDISAQILLEVIEQSLDA